MKIWETIKHWFIPYSSKYIIRMVVETKDLSIVGCEKALEFVENIIQNKLKALEDLYFVSSDTHNLVVKAERFNIDGFIYWLHKDIKTVYEPHWAGFDEIKLTLHIYMYENSKRCDKFGIILKNTVKSQFDWKVHKAGWIKPIPVK